VVPAAAEAVWWQAGRTTTTTTTITPRSQPAAFSNITPSLLLLAHASCRAGSSSVTVVCVLHD